MTFQLRHTWPEQGRRLLTAEIVTCTHCGTLRVTEEGRPTRYLQQGKESSEVAPPCLEPLPRRPPPKVPFDLLGEVRRRRAMDPDPDPE